MNMKDAFEKTPKPVIKHFRTWTGTKWRNVAEPQEPLKTALKELNTKLGPVYEQILRNEGLSDIPQAYRRGKSVKDNAIMHAKNPIWFRYDFSGFYDTIRFEDFSEYLEPILPDIRTNARIYRQCFIDPKTKGLTQGSPTSGVLAGIACIPFWKQLKSILPDATITQYSDDLCISGITEPQATVTWAVQKAINASGLKVILNREKTRMDSEQFRRLTGVSCNAQNQLTPRRNDYRSLRALFHNIRAKGPVALLEADRTACQTLGQLSFMSHIDTSGKIHKLEESYPDVIAMLYQIRAKELGGY